MDKLLWVKFGWSEFYRGGPVDGNFPFITDGEQGHEAWNFAPQDDGTYYCYTPPQSGTGTPYNADSLGWTVVCLAKAPGQKGIHVVGWYENAELVGDYAVRPVGFDPGAAAPVDKYLYSIRSKSAFFVPPKARTSPFSHTSVRQGKYSFLEGPDVSVTANKRAVREILKRQLKTLRAIAVHNPDIGSAPDDENDETDPLKGFGSPEHRKAVELAAVAATTAVLKRQGYTCVSRESDNIGYDLEAIRKIDGSALHVEVKGTASSNAGFFMTSNEHGYRVAPEWRLAMVTDALKKPDVTLRTLREIERDFDLTPMVWRGREKVSP